MTLVLMKYFLTQTVYVDAPAVPTAVAETQTLKVIYKYARAKIRTVLQSRLRLVNDKRLDQEVRIH